jgi:Raf kinase inhibitor-like YbhB/YbcL family protein
MMKILLFLFMALLSCSGNKQIGSNVITLKSSAFGDGQTIPQKYTYHFSGQCNGENFSPPLEWEVKGKGVRSFAVVCIDPDGGNWVHWIQFNIPDSIRNLPEEINGPPVGIKGRNDWQEMGYGGPCPPAGTHRYIFTIYALDPEVPLLPGASKRDLDSAIENHVLGKAELKGLVSR